MDIFKYDLYGGPNVGIYARANNECVFLPNGFATTKAEHIEEYLGVVAHYVAVANTRLIGTMMIMNNKGMLLPKTCSKDEMEFFKSISGLNVGILDTKYTALGNMICANDNGAVISPLLTKEDGEKVSDILGVEVVHKRIAGYNQVGAVISATSKGAIIHPESNDEDLKISADILKVDIEQATINGGVPFVSSGILANARSIITGSFTTGPEIMMLTRAFT
ncbi:MAG: translation initiation factor 6 [Cenarchaeum symbiont of Oopsacas minuta]|nr:translation initiation factor 6 [Cenarchaeum symbiont of Oopsacas minuta]